MSSRRVATSFAVALLGVLLFALAVETARGHSAKELIRGFACIHRFEGAWDANTGNGYYGGLQMSLQFQRVYGGEFLRAFGTADRWPASLQIAVAIRAYVSGAGYGPWPNTRRLCGL